jgi:hypothetical protein
MGKKIPSDLEIAKDYYKNVLKPAATLNRFTVITFQKFAKRF